MLDLIDVSVQFGGEYLFREVNFKINPSDKIALVGSNGAGKTTLLRIINGETQPESGKILKQKGMTIGYLPQEIVRSSGQALFHEVKSSLKVFNDLYEEEKDLTTRLAGHSVSDEERNRLIERLGAVHHRQEETGYYSIDSEIEKVLIGLGFSENDFFRNTAEFSGGWQMRIALAALLLSQNDLILLDEPTNHLDLDSLEWLIGYLKAFKGALLLISHDKHFVSEVTSKTLEIYMNKVSFFNGNYNSYLNWKIERDLQLEAHYIQQQKKIKETERFIERFRYKATKARQVQSRIKQLEKIETIELPDQEGSIDIRFPEPPSSGVVPMELSDITKSYGDHIVLNKINLSIDRGDKIAFVGPNGAGKTTLSKIISGQLDFDSGIRNVGYNTMISYYAQDVADSLPKELDILQSVDNIAENKTIGQLRSLLGSFLFTGDQVFKKISVLSGGEKSRVALCRILLTKANLIVLDEPTNHLDISSKQILQKALMDFPGTLIIVSHDVDFLSPVVNKVAEIRNNSVKIYNGNIDYYLEKKKQNDAEPVKQQTGKSTGSTGSNDAAAAGNRKEQKRLEAENRQKKYQATKDISKKIAEYEKDIEKLEKQKVELEASLADPRVYSNAQQAKETTAAYNDVKEKLENIFMEWTELTEKLEEIEKSFEL